MFEGDEKVLIAYIVEYLRVYPGRGLPVVFDYGIMFRVQKAHGATDDTSRFISRNLGALTVGVHCNHGCKKCDSAVFAVVRAPYGLTVCLRFAAKIDADANRLNPCRAMSQLRTSVRRTPSTRDARPWSEERGRASVRDDRKLIVSERCALMRCASRWPWPRWQVAGVAPAGAST